MIKRKKTRQIQVGRVSIGGDAPISVQTMTKTDTRDIKATLNQIALIAESGCDIVRCAVPDEQAAITLCEAIKESPIPVIADIHFDYRIALMVIEGGIDGLRINPGNIGRRDRVETVVKEAKARNISIRIGVNSGSIEKELLKKYGWPTSEAMVESAISHIRILEDLDFNLIKISLKASDVNRTVEAYRLLSEKVNYPLHLGITEAGGPFSGTIKSAIGIGILLSEGIGDTIRVSITGDPEEEVRVGREILKSLGLKSSGAVVVSCPTCGRIEVDLIPIVNEIEKRLAKIPYPLTIALMGCAVNGPGEAAEADIGLACGKGMGMIYVKGKPFKKVKESEMVETFIQEATLLAEKRMSESNA